MATPIEALQNRSNLFGNILDNSRTAYAPNTAPTKNDISTNTQFAAVNKQIEDLKSKQLRNEWYGPSTPAANTAGAPDENTGSPDEGWFINGLKALQRPLNAVAGTAQYALGKGTAPNWSDSVNNAMKTGVTFGNVLQQEGLPWGASAPLGFALDVMFDPVNWATAGTEALIPRVGMGFLKGGLAKAGVEAGTDIATSGLESSVKSAALEAAKTSATEGTSLGGTGLKSALEGGWSPTKALQTGWEGLKSGLEKKASTVMNLMPFAKNSETYANLAKNVGENAISSADKYDALMGSNVYDKLGKGLFGMPSGVIGQTAESLMNKIPSVSVLGHETPSGEALVNFFKYSPMDTAKIADVSDKVTMLSRNEGVILTSGKNGGVDFKDISDFLKPNASIDIKTVTKQLADAAVNDADHSTGLVNLRDEAGALKPEYIGKVKVADTIENAQTLLNTAGEDYNMKHLVKAYATTAIGQTGVSWYDNFITKMKDTSYNDIINYVRGKVGMPPMTISTPITTAQDVEKAVQEGADSTTKIWNAINAVPGKVASSVVGMTPGDWHPFEKVLNGLDNYTAFFKAFKVPMNVGSHVVNYVGNYFFGAMEGLPVYKPEWLAAMREAGQLLKGNLGITGIKEMFFNDANLMIDLADNNPARFRQLFGFNPTDIVGKISTEEKIRGVIPTKFGDVASFIGKQWTDLEEAIARGEKISSLEGTVKSAAAGESELAAKIGKKELKEELGAFKLPSETTKAALDEKGSLKASEELGTFTTSELPPNKAIDYIKLKLAKLAEDNPNNYLYKAADGLFNAMPKAYEQIDRVQKIGSANYMTKIGLTEQELVTVSRSVPITEKDLLPPVIRNGEKLYRLTPLKASEVSMETYMNYAAMPDAVKVMRALPIVGSNFYSFQYAMAIKTAKTLINNPAIFNKVGFALSEYGGERSPAEKVALQQKYNQYLNSPSVIKVVGMWNTDVKNVIPYYGMNMFNPSEKTYDTSKPQGRILQLSDSLPILQTPIGQVIKDYFIQPWILSGTGEIPQGQFGQPLYPSYDANGKQITPGWGTMAFYGARTLAESVVPGTFSYLGAPLGAMGISPDTTNFIPSYGIRGIANAAEGRSTIGAMTKENAIEKTLKAVLGRSGIPAYTLDTTQTTPTKKP